MYPVIENVRAREIYDSRGNPTIEVDVLLSNGVLGRAAVPSGASTGEMEAIELRDQDERLGGRGVLKAVKNVNTIINKHLKGMSPFDQESVDKTMIKLDGTNNKRKLGANAILGVSMATVRSAALATNQPLFRYLGGLNLEIPQSFHNVLNGGEHSDNAIDIQEFMITPIAKSSFRDGFEKIVNTYHSLKEILKRKHYETGLGDEGGFAPYLDSSIDAIKIIRESILNAGYIPGQDIGIAIDAAASYFYKKDLNKYSFEGKEYTSNELMEYYGNLLSEFPEIISIEDPFSEDDWDSFSRFTTKFGSRVQIVVDDPVCTNPKLIKKAISCGMGNSILIKLNQIGTVSETLEAMRTAKKNGYTTMMSHRSGETEDSFISDFSVATNSAQLKAGAPARSERVEKYNQLLRIEEIIGIPNENLAHFSN